MQNETMREQTAEQVARDIMKGARADLHIQVQDGETKLKGGGNNIGLLLAMSAVGATFIKSRLENGCDLESCKGTLQAALKQAVADATEGDQTKS